MSDIFFKVISNVACKIEVSQNVDSFQSQQAFKVELTFVHDQNT